MNNHVNKIFYINKHKSKQNENILRNFRPISILSSLEAPITKRVYDNAIMESEFSENIFSFRRGKSA